MSNHTRRRRTVRSLREVLFQGGRSTRLPRDRKPLRVESLEDRLLLTGDVGWELESLAGCLVTAPVAEGEAGLAGASAAGWTDSVAEGEQTPAQDLVAFAKALTSAGAKLYGAAWCPACNAQKALFEDGADFLPFVEVSNPDRTQNQIGISANITAYPTWEFPDGTREVGMLSLATISTRAGVAIPTGIDPFVAPIPDEVVLFGSPLHIGLDGYDPNGDPLTFTVTSSNPSLVSATVQSGNSGDASGNRSALITVEGWGTMAFELFEDRVPVATQQFITLAESGFYDETTYTSAGETPIIVHRVMDDFMMQFGDPTGTGTGGSSLPDFDDDFHVDLQHNTAGALSWAKSGDDTNNSQVFITDVPTRGLDFNHSYFGQLTEGDKVRDAITATAVIGTDDPETLVDESTLPTYPVIIKSVEIYDDTENGVVMLKALGPSGEADVTVTVTDSDGNHYAETLHVTVEADTSDGAPFLGDLSTVQTAVNTPATFQLTSTDVEGDAVVYEAAKIGTVDYSYTIDATTGEVLVTPPDGYVGTMEILVGVRQSTQADTFDTFDTQVVPIEVALDGPTAVDLAATSDTGYLNDDDLTAAASLEFTVTGVADGAVVRLYHGDTLIGEATASGTTAQVTTTSLSGLGDGTYAVYATQVISGSESAASPTLDVTIDVTGPPNFTSTPPSSVVVGQQLVYNAENPAEGGIGVSYSLLNTPAEATIDAADGTLSWTPTATDVGQHAFSVVIQDAAGNQTTQAVALNVISDDLVAFSLTVTDTQGNEVSTVDIGDDFTLNVYVQDLRFGAQGVFAAFLDVIYDATLVGVTGSLTFGEKYQAAPIGNLGTAGLIDEAGALAGLTQLGSSRHLLFSVPMQATTAGVAEFVTDPADNLPDNELLIFGSGDPVDVDQTLYGTVSLTVDVAFDAVDDLFNVDEDSTGTVLDVLSNDDQQAGSSGELIVTAVDTSAAGADIQIATDGKSLSYSPPTDFFGDDTFTYTISDGTGSKQATVTVQVTPMNDDPVAVDDQFTVTEDAVSTALDLLANDEISPDINEDLEITAVGTASAGGVVVIATGGTHVLYTPAENFFGSETFSYTIIDGNEGTATGTVTVNVTEANDPPSAQNDQFTVTEDSIENVLDVLANDDTAGDANESLTIVDVGVSDAGGTVVIAQDKLSLSYTPAPDFFGAERFIYTISDGNGGTAQASVTVIVNGTNDPPTAGNDNFVVVKDTGPHTLDVLSNDSFAPDNNETLTITGVGLTSGGGVVTIAADGLSLQYTPATGYTGTDTFTYTIEDGNDGTATATVTIDVRDYIPSSLSGYVYLDVDGDGVKHSAHAPLGGVVITLTGTDLFDVPITQTTKTDAHGYYEFTDLAPGTYTLTETQPKMLLDGIDTIGTQGGTAGNDVLTVHLEQDTHGESNNFGEMGRPASAISLFSFFASTPRDTVLATITDDDGPGWYAIEGGWSHAAAMSILNDQVDTAKLLVTAEDGLQYTSTLELKNPAQVHPFASGRILKIIASPAVLFPGADCACADSGAEAEGEAGRVTVVSAGGGEGEAALVAAPWTWAYAGSTEGEAPLPLAAPGPSAPPVTLASSAAIDQLMLEENPGTVTALNRGLAIPAAREFDYADTLDWLLANPLASVLDL